MTTHEDLLDRLDETRERLLMALEPLPDAALLAPGAVGRWSIADLLSILTAWDAEVVTGLLRLKQGKSPDKLLAAVRNPDAYNAGRYQDAQGRDLDVIFEDFQGARLHLEDWLGEFSAKALADPNHYKALGGVALGRLIAQATYENEARYIPFLQTFAERWQPPADLQDEIITLAGIDVLDLGLAPDNGQANGDTPWGHEADDDDDDDSIDFA